MPLLPSAASLPPIYRRKVAQVFAPPDVRRSMDAYCVFGLGCCCGDTQRLQCVRKCCCFDSDDCSMAERRPCMAEGNQGFAWPCNAVDITATIPYTPDSQCSCRDPYYAPPLRVLHLAALKYVESKQRGGSVPHGKLPPRCIVRLRCLSRANCAIWKR